MFKVTVSGSFHRHLAPIKEAIQQFQENGCEVLSPRDVTVVAEMGDFLFVASDIYRSILIVENRHLFSIAACDFLWLVTPDGYIGQSAALEIGYAIAKGKPIYCERMPHDLTVAEYLTVVRTPNHAIEDYKRTQTKQSEIASNVLLDPIEGTKEAHNLVDKIAYLLTKPGIITPSELEKQVTTLTRKLVEMFNITWKR